MKETDRTPGKSLHEMELKSGITNQAETGVEEKQARGTGGCGKPAGCAGALSWHLGRFVRTQAWGRHQVMKT